MKNLLKTLTLCLLASIYLAACDKKEPDTPGYYFKFQADGVAYNYEYECETGFSGSACNMAGFQSTSTAWGGSYQIYGHSFEVPSARGEVRFYLNKDDFNNLDTIILDGDRNKVGIIHLNLSDNNYTLDPPLLGKITITEKNAEYLKGTFYFNAYHINYDGSGGRTVTDTILDVTQGEFFVGRSN